MSMSCFPLFHVYFLFKDVFCYLKNVVHFRLELREAHLWLWRITAVGRVEGHLEAQRAKEGGKGIYQEEAISLIEIPEIGISSHPFTLRPSTLQIPSSAFRVSPTPSQGDPFHALLKGQGRSSALQLDVQVFVGNA